MSTRVTDYKEAVDHLPAGAILVLQDVTWEDYEQLLEELWDHPGMRVTYDRGRLEIMSPLLEHERCKEFIARMVYALGDELDVDVEGAGSTTWKKKEEERGTEPDTCFYVANARRIIGNIIDLNVDPLPDIAVEVDTTSETLDKLSVYSTLGVPEIWRYDTRRRRARIYELREGAYVEIPSSRFFPILTGAALVEFIEQSKTQGHKAALAAFRQWIRTKIR